MCSSTLFADLPMILALYIFVRKLRGTLAMDIDLWESAYKWFFVSYHRWLWWVGSCAQGGPGDHEMWTVRLNKVITKQASEQIFICFELSELLKVQNYEIIQNVI